MADAAAEAARGEAERIAGEIQRRDPLDAGTMEAVLARVKERQQAVGYDGDFARWIERMTPPDQE